MIQSVTLELSLKPFKQTDEAYIRKTCAALFEQWAPLIKNRKTISVMLWASDGSEILDYNKNLDAPFEWAYFLGTANLPLLEDDDILHRSLHERKQYYMENPPVMTYRILQNIVRILKEEGKKRFPNASIQVGETFDIGPEFAISEFKYVRHTEICSGTALDRLRFVDSSATLNADSRPYAAYPNGIPDGTPFGLFFGKQSDIFLKDMGFDFLWLSNGLGFSSEPWELTGKIFDGERFYPEKLPAIRTKVFEFWKQFRIGCKDIPLQTRGTNNSVGIDYATDGVPLYDIYNSDLHITPPPNSPWAALNDDFGLELMGHMTRICNLPGEAFMFRYYIHDPWWVNSPWYDRYQGYPHDIYLPMAISRITEEGNVQSAEMLNILSVDNSYGNLPDSCVYEPLPHLLKAEKNSPDCVAPFVWLYPMHEYTTAESEAILSEMYHGDMFIRQAINQGFPLNCVVSTDVFAKSNTKLHNDTVIIAPILYNEEITALLNARAEAGGRVIVYGSRNALCREALSDKIKTITIDDPHNLMQAVKEYGYEFATACLNDTEKPVTMTIHKSNNAFYFSVYNTNTTREVKMKFPLGAPVLLNGETVIRDGYATYHFPRCDYRECRVFVQQKDGVVRAFEQPPVNNFFRRRICIEGLENATLYLFPEHNCIHTAKVGYATAWMDGTPELDIDFEIIENGALGSCLKLENITGNIILFMPKSN